MLGRAGGTGAALPVPGWQCTGHAVSPVARILPPGLQEVPALGLGSGRLAGTLRDADGSGTQKLPIPSHRL